ncbi:hypothetical protein Tco_0971692 [Tanacetum coccineum]
MSTPVNTSSTEISVVKQKYDELVKKSLLTRSQFEGQLKEKSKVISDLKVKEGRDIDKMMFSDPRGFNGTHKFRLDVRYPETAKDKTYLPESGKLCNPMVIADIDDKYHGPVMPLHTLPSYSRSLKGFLFHLSEIIQFDRLSSLELADIEKRWAVRSCLPAAPTTKPKALESRALRSPKVLKHVHDITWRLYDTCGVHHVSTKDGIDIYMLVEKEYPLSRGVLIQMLAAKLLVEQNNEMSIELLRKIFMMAERPRRDQQTASSSEVLSLEDLLPKRSSLQLLQAKV